MSLPALLLDNEDDIPPSPPLKWAGGKRWLLPTLRPLYGGHRGRRLVEPFVGGLSVALGLRPKEALLNDINGHAINFYKHLQSGLHISLPLENESRCYYTHRKRFNEIILLGEADGPEAASLFYYLNRTGFNGLCRFNRRGLFNVPFGRYDTINYLRDFSAYRMPLKHWKFKAVDFQKLRLRPTDFIYSDPPYDVPFTSYAERDFSWWDQIRLAEWLAQHPGPVVASNQATERIVKLYSGLGFNILRLSAPRMISCTGDRTRAEEILALRNLA